MLRAGPFSDERVVRLINRRFIPFYFDLSDRGFAGDPAARKFVVAARREMGGASVSTPQVLFMTPTGKVVGSMGDSIRRKIECLPTCSLSSTSV